jgi:hypothetical protein
LKTCYACHGGRCAPRAACAATPSGCCLHNGDDGSQAG